MTNKSFLTILLTSLSCLFYQTPVSAAVYKWTDENGQIHFSDQPNKPDAEKYSLQQVITTKPRATQTKQESDEKSGEKSNEKLETKETKATEPEAPKISTKEKRRLCKEAKSDIAAIISRGRMREKSAKGEYTYLSEVQRQQRLSAAKKKQSEHCR